MLGVMNIHIRHEYSFTDQFTFLMNTHFTKIKKITLNTTSGATKHAFDKPVLPLA